jgi:hypothetical protein
VSAIWWLLLGGAALAAASTLFKARKAKELPDISNQEFLNVYRLRFNGLDNAVLAERSAIAECLGVPYQKLSPTQTFKSLSKYTGFITEYEIGMSDLGDELAHRYEQAGLKTPESFPETVGEFIHEIINATKKSKGPGGTS